MEYVVTDGAASPLKVMPAEDYKAGDEDRYYLWEQLVWPPTERVLACAFPATEWAKAYGRVRPKRTSATMVSNDDGSIRRRRRRGEVPVEQGKLF